MFSQKDDTRSAHGTVCEPWPNWVGGGEISRTGEMRAGVRAQKKK